MDKKKIIIILTIFIIAIILIIIGIKKKDNSIVQNNEVNINNEIEVTYDNSSGKREIISKDTGEVLYTDSENGDFDAAYEFYKENPDYRADPPSISIEEE